MAKYRITFTATYDCIVEADNADDAGSDAHIPEGGGSTYVTDSFEVVEVEEMEVIVPKRPTPLAGSDRGGESPYALRTNPGDRFIFQNYDHSEFDGPMDILMQVAELRMDGEDIWNCEPVIACDPDLWPHQKGARGVVLTEGEVQTKISHSKKRFIGDEWMLESGKDQDAPDASQASAGGEELTELTEILVHAWEPNGVNSYGGFDWTYLHGGERTNDEFLAEMNKAILHDAMIPPSSGGMSDVHYIIYAYAPSDMPMQEVNDHIHEQMCWLANGRLKEPYVVGQPLKLEADARSQTPS